jgi:hypothetical protein
LGKGHEGLCTDRGMGHSMGGGEGGDVRAASQPMENGGAPSGGWEDAARRQPRTRPASRTGTPRATLVPPDAGRPRRAATGRRGQARRGTSDVARAGAVDLV